MSVLIETSLGDIVIDLYTQQCPLTSRNFIKLCKLKYYNHALFYDIQRDFITRIKSPVHESTSIYELVRQQQNQLNNSQQYQTSLKYFKDEIHPYLRHDRVGIVSTSNQKSNENCSDFFIQLSDDNLQHLNNKHTVFGVVQEGIDVLQKLNDVYVDDRNRPFYNIRILHTLVIDDPFDDVVNGCEIQYLQMESPDYSGLKDNRLEYDENNIQNLTEEQLIERTKQHQIQQKKIVLEMMNDLPDSDIKPPDNILFVCKLNPLTNDNDLFVIFSRFGEIKSCEIIKDWKTGASLGYAFIEFMSIESCEEAYFKMNNSLIDDRRIQVDFSQSVSKLWRKNQMKRKKQLEEEQEQRDPKQKGVDLNKYLTIKLTQRKDNQKYNILYDQDQFLDTEQLYIKKLEQQKQQQEKKDSDQESNSKKKPKSRSHSRNKRQKSRSHSRKRKKEQYDRYKKSSRSHHKKKRSRSRSYERKKRSRSRDRDRKHRKSRYK